MFEDLKQIFEIPISGQDRKNVEKLILYIDQLSVKGGGQVPLKQLLAVAGLDAQEQVRIQKTRGDLILRSQKGTHEGLFINAGKKMREKIPNVPLFTPELVADKKVGGNFKVSKGRLDLTRIQGLMVFKSLGEDLFDLKYNVRQVILTPKAVTVL